MTRSEFLRESNRASAKANAYANCGMPNESAAWQREHQRILNGTPRRPAPTAQQIAQARQNLKDAEARLASVRKAQRQPGFWAFLARITEPRG